MKKRTQVLVLTLTALTTVACSHTPMPVAKNFPYSEQRIMQAAHHWDVLAAVVAEKVYQKINAEHFSMPAQPLVSSMPQQPAQPPIVPFTPQSVSPYPAQASNAPVSVNDSYTPLNVYQGTGAPSNASFQPVASAPAAGVYGAPQAAAPGFTSASAMMQTSGFPPLFMPQPSSNDTTFKKTFYNLLRSRLVQNDLLVVSRMDGPYSACYSPNVPCKSLVLDYDINVVQHKDRDAPIKFPGRATTLAVLGGATAYIIDHASHSGEMAWSVIPLAAMLEWPGIKKMYWPNETNTEVAITVTVSDGDFVVFSDSNLFYVNTGDSDHYEKGARTYRVVDQ